MGPVHGVEQRDVEAVVEVLARYLLDSPRFRCDGFDGATVGDVVAAEYPVAAVGWVPGPAELAARHPDLAEALGGFFRIG